MVAKFCENFERGITSENPASSGARRQVRLNVREKRDHRNLPATSTNQFSSRQRIRARVEVDNHQLRHFAGNLRCQRIGAGAGAQVYAQLLGCLHNLRLEKQIVHQGPQPGPLIFLKLILRAYTLGGYNRSGFSYS